MGFLTIISPNGKHTAFWLISLNVLTYPITIKRLGWHGFVGYRSRADAYPVCEMMFLFFEQRQVIEVARHARRITGVAPYDRQCGAGFAAPVV